MKKKNNAKKNSTQNRLQYGFAGKFNQPILFI